MISRRYRYRSWSWIYHEYVADLVGGSEYYVFVEEVGPANPEGMMRPDEKPFDENIMVEELSDRSWRIRASGIDAAKFRESAGAFEELDHDNVTDGERRRRKDQLNEVFGEQPLPIFDLYLGPKDADYQYLRGILVPGAWYWVVVRKWSPEEDALPIFVGAPELPDSPYMPGALGYVDAVPLPFEYRLRDIFSLVHISDAEFGEETGGEGEPLPPDPDVGPELSRWEQPARQLYRTPQAFKSAGD